MVSAEYGGTGGKPLEGGMIVEEPDIEIGQGVSSKGLFDLVFLHPRLIAFVSHSLSRCLQAYTHIMLTKLFCM